MKQTCRTSFGSGDEKGHYPFLILFGKFASQVLEGYPNKAAMRKSVVCYFPICDGGGEPRLTVHGNGQL